MRKFKPETALPMTHEMLLAEQEIPPGMLYLAHQRHKPEECPGNTPKHVKEMSEMFSPNNLSRTGLKFIDGYIDHACMVQSSGPDHVCSFLFEGSSEQAVADVFKPFPVEVKSIVSWGRFASGAT